MLCPHCGKEIKAQAPDRFDEWWSYYPRKSAKGQALKAYKHALSKTSAETLIVRCKLYRDLVAKKGLEKEFIPMGSTWLNGERWLDEEITSQIPPFMETPLIALHKSWGPYHAAMVKALGLPKLTAWFGNTEITGGDGKPWTIIVDKPLKRDWILKNYATVLYNTIGEFEIMVRA